MNSLSPQSETMSSNTVTDVGKPDVHDGIFHPTEIAQAAERNVQEIAVRLAAIYKNSEVPL